MTIDRNLDVSTFEGSLLEVEDPDPAQAQLDASRVEIARLRQELSQARADHQQTVEMLVAQLDLVSAELCVNASRFDRALEALEAEHGEVVDRMNRHIDQQRIMLTEQVEAYRTRVEELESSTSWRVTAGLRFVSKLLSGS